MSHSFLQLFFIQLQRPVFASSLEKTFVLPSFPVFLSRCCPFRSSSPVASPHLATPFSLLPLYITVRSYFIHHFVIGIRGQDSRSHLWSRGEKRAEERTCDTERRRRGRFWRRKEGGGRREFVTRRRERELRKRIQGVGKI